MKGWRPLTNSVRRSNHASVSQRHCLHSRRKSHPDPEGSRFAYSKVEEGRDWQTTVTPELESFVAEMDMFYLGTANAEGQPYIQYRGGSPGFLKVVDEKTLGFADFGGNRQYITLGNSSENLRRSSSSWIMPTAAASSSGVRFEWWKATLNFSINCVIRRILGKSNGPSCSRSLRGT